MDYNSDQLLDQKLQAVRVGKKKRSPNNNGCLVAANLGTSSHEKNCRTVSGITKRRKSLESL